MCWDLAEVQTTRELDNIVKQKGHCREPVGHLAWHQMSAFGGGLKIRRANTREGSSPSSGTSKNKRLGLAA